MDVKLVVFKRNGRRKDLPIPKSIALIGRSKECTLQIPILTVSRRHCELTVGEAQVLLKDLGSANGTFVNNQRIDQTDLVPGDRIVIGPVVFTVQIDGMPEQISPVKTRGERLAPTAADSVEDLALEEAIVQEISESDQTAAPEVKAKSGGEEIDPISALEALAAEEDED